MHLLIVVPTYLVLLWLVYRRSATLFYVFLGIFFGMTWRLVSAVYIDLHVGTYAVELFREIGGGYSALTMVLFNVALVSGILVAVSRQRLQDLANAADLRKLTQTRLLDANIPFILTVLLAGLIAIVYLELLSIGTIPLFTGMDRGVYRASYAGPFALILLKYVTIIFFTCGLLYFVGTFKGAMRGSILALSLLALMVYLVLIGNKFSTIFFSFTYFLIPYGAFYLKSAAGGHPLLDNPARFTIHKVEIALGIVCILGLIFFALYNALFVLRGLQTADIVSYLQHRVFVQQAQLWWTAHERVVIGGEYHVFEALNRIFLQPIKEGNTSLYFLMARDLGHYITGVLAGGGHYTGAYPTILLEMFGPAWSLLAAFVMAYIMGRLMVVLLAEVLNARLLSAIALMFVILPFITFHLGGRLSFLVQWTYLAKLVLTLCVMMGERTMTSFARDGKGRPRFAGYATHGGATPSGALEEGTSPA
jgi:hypothetical protein